MSNFQSYWNKQHTQKRKKKQLTIANSNWLSFISRERSAHWLMSYFHQPNLSLNTNHFVCIYRIQMAHRNNNKSDLRTLSPQPWKIFSLFISLSVSLQVRTNQSTSKVRMIYKRCCYLVARNVTAALKKKKKKIRTCSVALPSLYTKSKTWSTRFSRKEEGFHITPSSSA